ncbi:TM2 domain-containing protein [Flavobacterium pectinovorum]|uniref:TM2 domain-containing protein n=1 Tax=Flavobacterium pectinovorum TaxID=29533 RepID=UPI001FACBEAC|nr:TM2 domain-containing protein [Flavobacterium pectinovorum]MCI9844414.1 TM2 domain-containing protein [Flavobacterium pectinovorum]
METTRPTEHWNNPPVRREENKKVVAGILGILVGYLGIHKFYLGYTKEGIIQILLNLVCGLGGLIGLIEGIIYLVKTDEEFYQTYQVGRKPWL